PVPRLSSSPLFPYTTLFRSREVVVAVHPRRLETLVVAQIEVGLGAVLGDEHLPVLEGAHRAGIDVDVRVELEEGDFDAARFEDRDRKSTRLNSSHLVISYAV